MPTAHRHTAHRSPAATIRRFRGPGGALLALLAALLMFGAGCGSNDGSTATTATDSSPTTTISGSAKGTDGGKSIDCTAVPNDGGNESCPTVVVTDPAAVKVSTSEGDFEIELAVDQSPATTTSFRHLVEDGFYDGLNFNRVVKGFVIQGGDPLANDSQRAGTGGPGYYVDEPVPAGAKYTQGVVAMAKTGTDPAGRSGSQFFVVSGKDAGLPPDYAYVGQVVSGFDTVEKIESLGVTDGPPSREVTIDSMSVVAPAAS